MCLTVLYDILQRTNIENAYCSSFYGQKAEIKVLERTYDDLEKVHKLDDYTRYNSYTAPFKRDFVNMLSLTRYRCEERERNRKKEENRKLIEENKKLEERLQQDKMEEEPVGREDSGNIERSIPLVIQSEVGLYDRPDLNGTELLELEKGTDVSVLEIMGNGWYRVVLDKKEGYIQYMNIPETN